MELSIGQSRQSRNRINFHEIQWHVGLGGPARSAKRAMRAELSDVDP
jgi:hypothetical protein